IRVLLDLQDPLPDALAEVEIVDDGRRAVQTDRSTVAGRVAHENAHPGVVLDGRVGLPEGPLPPSDVIPVPHEEAALEGDIGTVAADGGNDAGVVVGPRVVDDLGEDQEVD